VQLDVAEFEIMERDRPARERSFLPLGQDAATTDLADHPRIERGSSALRAPVIEATA